MPKETDSQKYRRLAAECTEVAKRMSLRTDREQMTEMAQNWLSLAEQAEARGSKKLGDHKPRRKQRSQRKVVE